MSDRIQFCGAHNKRIHELEFSCIKNIQQNISHTGCNEDWNVVCPFQPWNLCIAPQSYLICNLLSPLGYLNGKDCLNCKHVRSGSWHIVNTMRTPTRYLKAWSYWKLRTSLMCNARKSGINLWTIMCQPTLLPCLDTTVNCTTFKPEATNFYIYIRFVLPMPAVP